MRTKNTPQTTPPNDHLLSLPEAAALLGVAVQTLRNWICQGRLTSTKVGRRRLVPYSVIQAVIAAGTEGPSCHPSLRLV